MKTVKIYNGIVSTLLVIILTFGMIPSTLINAHAKTVNSSNTWVIEVNSKEEQDAVLAQIDKENKAVENAWNCKKCGHQLFKNHNQNFLCTILSREENRSSC